MRWSFSRDFMLIWIYHRFLRSHFDPPTLWDFIICKVGKNGIVMNKWIVMVVSRMPVMLPEFQLVIPQWCHGGVYRIMPWGIFRFPVFLFVTASPWEFVLSGKYTINEYLNRFNEAVVSILFWPCRHKGNNFAGSSLRRPGFDPRAFLVGLMKDKVVQWRVPLWELSVLVP